MKKIFRIMLVGLGIQLSGALYAVVVQDEQAASENLEKALHKAEQSEKITPEKKSRLRTLLRELKSLVSRKRKLKREARSLEDLQAQYDIAARGIRIKSTLASLGITVGTTALGVTALAVSGVQGQDMGEGAGMVFLLPLFTYFLSHLGIEGISLLTLYERYRERALKELVIPREKEKFDLIQEMRRRRSGGKTEEQTVLMNQLSKLDVELAAIEKRFGVFGRDERLISLVLDSLNKKITTSSPQFKLFKFAITKNKGGLEQILEHGDIHLFDEAWVWPALARMYYFSDTRPVDELVKELKNELNWDTWRKYRR